MIIYGRNIIEVKSTNGGQIITIMVLLLLIYTLILFILWIGKSRTNELISGLFYVWCSLAYASIILLILGDIIGISFLYENEHEGSLGSKAPPKILFFPMVLLFSMSFLGGIRAIQNNIKKKKK